MRVDVVDPSAYTPPYDHSLCAALAAAGAAVQLITSPFAYGSPPAPVGYARREDFYRLVRGPAGSRRRQLGKLLEHGPDMARYRAAARSADVVHFQWLPVPWLDRHLLPSRPMVLTAHDLLPRESRPGQVAAQRRLYDAVDAVVVHSAFGRDQLVQGLEVPANKVTVIPHGAFDYLTSVPGGELPGELGPDADRRERPVVMFFGLLRPYKGLDVLFRAWRALNWVAGGPGAELWIVGYPRVPLEELSAQAPPGVRMVPRFVSEPELAACFRRADLLVLPYLSRERFDFSGVLATALAFGTPAVISDVGGFSEVAATGAARLVAPGDAAALTSALSELITDDEQRRRMAESARAAASGPYSWSEVAARTLALYETIS
ncbi:MAG: glycosyltransferase family 4 protein [Solirubrobacteraceae bacterium]